MKKTIFYLLALLIIPIAAFGGGTTVVVGQPVAASACAGGTFGNATEGGTELNGFNGYLLVTKFNSGACGTGCNSTTISAWLKDVATTSFEVHLVVYSDNAGEPNSRLGFIKTYDAGSSGTAKWVADTLAVAISASTDYWIGVGFENGGTELYLSATTGGASRKLGYTFSNDPPATWDTGSDTAYDWIMETYISVE